MTTLLGALKKHGISLALIRDCYAVGQVNALPDTVLAGALLTDTQDILAHNAAIEAVQFFLSEKDIDCALADVEELLMQIGA